MESISQFNHKQIVFKELFVGTLIYALILGFLNDYTDIVVAKSFSTIFFSSIVLQILTLFAFRIKKHLFEWFRPMSGTLAKAGMFFSVWLIMFISKFVFIWALDLLFSSYITINGFFGILLVVVLVTAVHKLADYTFVKLDKPRNS